MSPFCTCKSLRFIFNDQASIEKLAAASKNPELINHTNIRNVWNHQQKVKTNNEISKSWSSIIRHQTTQTSFPCIIPEVQIIGVYLATLLSKNSSYEFHILVTQLQSRGVCENITIAFTLSNFYACAVIDKEKKRNLFNI